MRKDNYKVALQRNVILNDTYQVRQVLASSELAIVYAGRDKIQERRSPLRNFSRRDWLRGNQTSGECTVLRAVLAGSIRSCLLPSWSKANCYPA